MKKYHKWTEQEDIVLIQSIKDKIPYATIATLLAVTTSKVTARVKFLKKKGIELPSYNLVWTEKLEKELLQLVSKNEGNLSNAFREFAEKHNTTTKAVSTRWYDKNIPTGRLKDKSFCFGIFGRFRGAANSKNYNKANSKTYKFWKVIKTIFN